MRSDHARRLKTLRIVSQALFAGLFLLTFALSLDPFKHVDNYFLRSDPLVFLTHLTVDLISMLLMTTLLLMGALLGRVFCGWICPMGTLTDLLDWVAGPLRRRLASRLDKTRWDRLTETPPALFILGALIPALFLAPPVMPFFHPNVWMVRIVSLTMPGIVFAVVLLFFSLFTRRLWCKWLCPLGALYGLLGRVSIFRLAIEKCSACSRCDGCPMGAADYPSRRIRSHQCTLCFDYEYRCPVEGFSIRRSPDMIPTVPGRREFLRQGGLLAGGAIATSLIALPGRSRAAGLLRPPGVLDEQAFVKRCLRCLQCVESCPNGIIHPTLMGAGLADVLTPHIRFVEYGCDYFCQVCQTVCPNLAIPLQSLPEKQQTAIGKAQIDEKSCVIFKDDLNCLVCEEVCPVPGKAIGIREEVIQKDGKELVLRYPYMRDEDCIGCGICQVGCPATPVAIVVKSERRPS